MIKNLTQQIVAIRFNSGAEMYLEPGGRHAEPMDSEVRNNAALCKLVAGGLLAVTPAHASGLDVVTAASEAASMSREPFNPTEAGSAPSTKERP